MRYWSYWIKTFVLAVLLGIGNCLAAQSFILNGSVVGKDSGTVILYYRDINQKPCRDIVNIRDGKFQFIGTVLGADYALIDTDTTYLKGDNTHATYLFIQPGETRIQFEFGNIGNAHIHGASAQAESVAWSEHKKEKIRAIRKIASAIDSIKVLLKDARIEPGSADEQIKMLAAQSAPIWQSLADEDLIYIKNNPGSYVSMMLLHYLVGQVPNDSIDHLFDKLTDTVQNSSVGYAFIKYYSGYKKAIGEEYPYDQIKISDKAPAFSIYQGTPDSLQLDDLKGTVVLLEFWELTCLPCLHANPLIENIRKQYGDKKLKVIAVNSTSPQEIHKLKSYITKNMLADWVHVSTHKDSEKQENIIFPGDFKNYYGLGVPRTVLIDKSGNVVYKRFGFEPEDLQGLKSAIQKALLTEIY